MLCDETVMAVQTPSFDAITSLVEDAQTIAVCAHTSPDGDALGSELALVEMIERACDEMGTLLAELPQFKRSKTLRSNVVNINSIEEEADSVYIAAMRELHTTGTDPMLVFTWHEVYTFLEYCVDSVEHVADTVDSIVMKNS